MEFDDGSYEVISREELYEQIYSDGFKAPTGKNGELVFVSGDDARAAAAKLAEETGRSADSAASICYHRRYGMLHWKNGQEGALKYDNGDYEDLSTEEWRERIYGPSFYVPISGELVYVSDDENLRGD